MPTERVALYLQDAHSLQDGIKYAQYAESKSLEAVWQTEGRLVRDAIVPMMANLSNKGEVNDERR